MAAKQVQVEFYKDKKKEYRWRLRAKNGRILADSAEGYVRRGDCTRAYTRMATAVLADDVKVEKLDSWTSK